ncbi:MAG: lamin tail domain-containing protein [Akkermansiaceae bacterium]
MMKWMLFFGFGVAFLTTRVVSGEIVISEFMASNKTTITDEDGDFSDWIELSNTGTGLVNIEGWFLTDDASDPAARWELPLRFIPPGGQVLIFASGKDRRPATPANELHTNFQLSASGEYLALIQPDGVTVASAFAPAYPKQEDDISYGRGELMLATENFVTEGDAGKVLVPTDGSLGVTWTGGHEPFSDEAWLGVKTGVGFDTGSGPTGFVLVDDFDSLNVGPLDGQGGWSTSATMAEVMVDPADVENQVMGETGNNVRAWKSMNITNGETATLFYRMRREGAVNISVGASDLMTPGTAYSDFEVQLNNQGNDVLNARDTGSFDEVEQFSDQTWYHVWMVIDNATDTYEVYMKGGALAERTLLDAGAQTTFGFRNGSANNAIETFFARTGNGETGTFLIDDIYLAEGENFGNPVSGRGLADFIDAEGDLESAMAGASSSAYLRVPFEIGEIGEIGSLLLRMRYDDGFVAYLNGVEIASRNAAAGLDWDSQSDGERANRDAVEFEEIDVTDSLGLLIPNATNVLSIHGLNVSAADGDFLITPELVKVAAAPTAQSLYFSPSTPGANNRSGFLGFVADTQFSLDRGFYDTPIQVEISSASEEAEIIYTTDGSLPALGNGTRVASPATVLVSETTPLRAVAVREGYLATNVDTHTYIFTADVVVQGNRPAGYPETWKGNGGNGSETADYEMDPEVTGSAEYGPFVQDALKAIPTISLVTDQGNLFDPATGIYQNPQQKGTAWERPVSFEIIHPNGDRQGLQVDAGIRIQGGHTRLPSKNPKHSFRVSFKREFGPTKLDYDLFPDDPDAAKSFDQLVLRGAGNQSWLHHNTFKGDNRGRAQYIRDQWAKDVQLAMGHPAARSMYAHVYINGIYWGMYNPSERGSAGFGESYLGGDKNDYHTLNSGEGVDGVDAVSDYSALVSLANGGLADPSRYAQIKELLDVEAFTDYMIIQQYGGNLDWDHHNWYALRNKNGGKWYYLCWDSEFVFISPTDNVLSLDSSGDPSRIWRRLLENEEYRVLFGDRVQQHLTNQGLLTPNAVTMMWDVRKDQMFDAIIAESARWGDYRRDVDPVGTPSPIPLYDRDEEWAAERTRLFDTYFPVRTSNLIAQYRAAGYLPSLEAPQFDHFGGRVAVGLPLEITSPDSEAIYFTTDGSDPRVGAEVIQLDLLAEGAAMKVFVPTDNALGGTWRGGAEPFDDSSWQSGTAAGYENTPGGYAELYDINMISEMRGISPSCLVRMKFTIPDQATLDLIGNLSLGVRYDDAFVAFLNGVQVAADNEPDVLNWDAEGANHIDILAAEYQPFVLSQTAISELKVGENILAIHSFNAGAGSSDFLIDAVLSATLETPSVVNTASEVYAGVISIDGPIQVKARVFDGNTWSALTEATFYTGEPADSTNLVISEIMYNPDGGDDTEFIEFLNIGNNTIDMSGVKFGEGLDFDFPLGLTLSPGERVLVVRDEVAFEALYGIGLPIVGHFLNGNNLDNAGDRLTLLAQNGEVIRTLRYNDRAPWPEEADGNGRSLVLIEPNSNPDHQLPESWQAGFQIGGTPGAGEGLAFTGEVLADEDGDGFSALLEFVLGTSDEVKDDAVNAVLLDTSGLLNVQRRSGIVGVDVVIESSTDLVTWTSAAGALQFNEEVPVSPGVVNERYQWTEENPRAFLRVRAILE